LIKSAYAEPTPEPKLVATSWRSKSSIKGFIYSSKTNKTPRPPSPPAQPQGIMKKPYSLSKLTNQNAAITTNTVVRPKTSKPRGSTSTTSSSAGRSSVGTNSYGQRGSISTTISEVSTGKQSNSSHSVISSASNGSGNSNKSEHSYMSVVSVRSNGSSEDGRPSKSVRYSADTKPPVPPKVAPTRESMPTSLQGRTSTRPTAAGPRRPQHVLKTVSKNAW
jgi:hypothetical protein